jgi:hypothetical protein
MHPAVSRIAENAVKHHALFAPLLFAILAAVAHVHTPTQHSLLVTTLSWAIIWVPIVFCVGIYSNSSSAKRTSSWLAGALLALSHICDRAACDKQGIWATKVDIPMKMWPGSWQSSNMLPGPPPLLYRPRLAE